MLLYIPWGAPENMLGHAGMAGDIQQRWQPNGLRLGRQEHLLLHLLRLTTSTINGFVYAWWQPFL